MIFEFPTFSGASRFVILLGRWAVKLPRLHWCGNCYPSCFARSLFGLYSNRVEADRWRRRTAREAERFARVIFGGAPLLVMERCAPVNAIERDDFAGIVNPTDMAPHNFGVTRDGRTVAVDYAYW